MICGDEDKIRTACDNNPKSDECTIGQSCLTAYLTASNKAWAFFRAVNAQAQRDPKKASYTLNTTLAKKSEAEQVKAYFDNDNESSNPITCTSVQIKPPPKGDIASDSPLARFRVRGKSDDLYLDRGQQEFKSAGAASANFTGDTNATHTYTTKIKGTLGYAFDAGLNGQVIPYGSLSQTLTSTALKPSAIDPTNNFAFGVLATTFVDTPDNADIKHTLSIKPQYLLNTADQSRVASVRAIYPPWTTLPDVPINLNAFQYLKFLPGDMRGTILLDLRNDFGTYTNRGNTAAIVATNADFDRAGTRVGVSLTTAPGFPSFTLVVAETYLYGLEGFYRKLDMFETSLTYNPESNGYFGITVTYNHGRDEDTAVAAQIWTVGLTGRY